MRAGVCAGRCIADRMISTLLAVAVRLWGVLIVCHAAMLTLRRLRWLGRGAMTDKPTPEATAALTRSADAIDAAYQRMATEPVLCDEDIGYLSGLKEAARIVRECGGSGEGRG